MVKTRLTRIKVNIEGKEMPHSSVITVLQRIEDTGGHATGFDYLRVILAIGIVCWHSIATSYGSYADIKISSSMYRPLMAIILPMFFSLSGFLVAGSLERSKTLFMFMSLRVIRIFPALCVEVLLSALVLGPILTQMTLQDYFSNTMFWHYFLNCTGDIHYVLPGVFSDNPYPYAVNAQLWTVPWELKCYISIALLTIIGAVRYRLMLLVSIICLIGAAAVYYSVVYPDYFFGNPKGSIAGCFLVVSFLLGVAMYLYSDKIIWDGRIALLACFVSLVLFSVRCGDVLVTIPVAYMTVYAGLLNPYKFGIMKGADYSYGVFLYGFPLQQAFVSLLEWTPTWWLNILVCVPLAFVVAAFSWHFVEKPALSLKKKLVALEALWIRACNRYFSWSWLPHWLHSSSSHGLASPEYRQ